MKINRFVALAVIALLVVAAMGFVSARSSAQTGTPPQAQVTPAAENKAEPSSGSDTDNVEEQVGDQSTADQPEAANAPEAKTAPDEKSPSYTGSLTVTEATTAGKHEADEATALASQAKITIEQAKAAALAANPGAIVIKAELDNENGTLVYSVELSSGADVKVDAGNGAILHTDTDADNGEVTGGPDTDHVQQGNGQQVEDGQPDRPNTTPEVAGPTK
jgi:uncharacterized membrane protein YkoI